MLIKLAVVSIATILLILTETQATIRTSATDPSRDLLIQDRASNSSSLFDLIDGFEQHDVTRPSGSDGDSPMSVYRTPTNSFVKLVKEFFNDIDWDTIARARDQIEAFIRKVDRIYREFRNGGRVSGRSSDSSNRFNFMDMIEGEISNSRMEEPEASQRLFLHFGKKNSGSKADQADGVKVKEMLNKVACFLGYMRMLNYSNEALAELGASKSLINLFNGKEKGSHWFG